MNYRELGNDFHHFVCHLEYFKMLSDARVASLRIFIWDVWRNRKKKKIFYVARLSGLHASSLFDNCTVRLFALLISEFKFWKVFVTAEVFKIPLKYLTHTYLRVRPFSSTHPFLSLTFCLGQGQVILCHYAPNFKEVGGAYCFWVVRPSVHSSRFLMHSITLEPGTLLFWNIIYGFLMKK